MIRDSRKPFCYQEIPAMRLIRERVPAKGGRPSRTVAVAVYQAFTEIANEQWRSGGRQGFEATRDEVAELAGVGPQAVDRTAKLLWELGLLGRKGRDGKPNLWVLYEVNQGGVPQDAPLPGDAPPASRGTPPTSKGEEKKKVEAAPQRGDWVPSEGEAPLSHLLADLIAANDADGSRPKVSKSWADAERLLQERDGRSATQIEYVIRWVQADGFEHTVVQSMPKLRQRYRQLLAKATRDAPATGRPGTRANADADIARLEAVKVRMEAEEAEQRDAA